MRWCAALLLAGCSVPDFHSGNLQCAAGNRCPDGFHCAGDNRCWKDGSDPDLAGGVEDLSMPNDASTVVVDMAGVDIRPADLRPPPSDLAHGDMLPECTTALLCDGFEAATLNAQWGIGSTNGAVTIDPARAFRGTHSLHLHTGQVPDGGSAEATVNETRTFPQSGVTVYVRVWTYIQSPYPNQFNQFINFTDASFSGIAYVLLNGFPLLNDYISPFYYMQGSAPAIPLDQWTCLQMSVTQTGATGSVHVMVDGVDSNASSTNTAPTTSMQALHLGLQFNGGGPGFDPADVWIDEVIVDNKSISCTD